MQSNWDRFHEAVIVLVGSGPVKQRLVEAYQSHLQQVHPDDLPREVRGSFATVATALHSVPRTGGLDSISASVRKMSELEAARHAQAIVTVFAGLQEPQPLARTLQLRAVPDDDIPAFLNRA